MATTLLTMGCKGVKYTSQGVYLGAMHEVENQLESMGFRPIGCGQESVNEPYAVGDEWVDDWVTYDIRSFADTTGCRVDYSVRYRAVEDGMQKVEVAGCEVNCTGDYTAICGDDGVVRKLNNLPTDKQSNDILSTSVGLYLVCSVLLPVFVVVVLAFVP